MPLSGLFLIAYKGWQIDTVVDSSVAYFGF